MQLSKILYWPLLLGFLMLSCHQPQVSSDTEDKAAQHQQLTDAAFQYEMKGNTDMALHYHRQALDKAKKNNLPVHEASSLVNIANLLKKDSADKSLQYLQQALAIANRLNREDLRSQIMKAMAGVYKQQRNYEQAIFALEAHQQLLEKLFAENRAREMQALKIAEQKKWQMYIYLIIIATIVTISVLMAIYLRRLKKLNNRLEESNMVKDKMFSIIAHDLRGPASGIQEALKLINSDALDKDEASALLQMLGKQSKSLYDTLETLLRWAGTQLKKETTNFSQFDVTILLRQVVAALEEQAVSKKITLSPDVSPGQIVNADKDQITFVLRNLISNAIKFSFEDGVVVIRVSSQDNEVIISIKDNGVGMSAHQQENFQRAASSMEGTYGSRGEKGTGLGLVLCKDFIAMNKGRIWVESNEGKGTAFFIALAGKKEQQANL